MAKSQQQRNQELVSLTSNTSPKNTTAGGSIFDQYFTSSARWQRLLAIILLGCFVLFIAETLEFDTDTGDVQIKLHKGSRTTSSTAFTNATIDETDFTSSDAAAADATESSTTTTNSGSYSSKCQTACAKKSSSDSSFFDGQDLTESQNMRNRLQSFRQKWIDEKLKVDYGADHYQSIFEPNDDESGEASHIGKHRVFVDPNRLPGGGGSHYDQVKHTDGPAWYRMVRKWTIKLLQVQVKMLQDKMDNNNYCLEECQSSGVTDDGGKKEGLYGKFTWVNGGHSASAGHGNLYRESYTATLGFDLQPILKEIGLDFQVRNYAMGATESGEEIGLCFNSIFGKDTDSITWDYGMTDGGDHWKGINYAYNAAKLALVEDNLSQPGNVRHRPSLWFLHQNDDQNGILQSLQTLGLPLLAMDRRFRESKIISAFPDTFGKSDAEIAAMPKYVQYFKCEEKVEAGDPGCNEFKFNHTICAERTGQNSWHPGWRVHALTGHMLAFTILELITDALDILIRLEPPGEETTQQKHDRLLSHLQKLDAMEQQDYENVFLHPLPQDLKQRFEDSLWKGDLKAANKEAMKDFPIEMMVKDHHFCHTARIPSEIRFRGLLTENFEETGPALDYRKYERSVLLNYVQGNETAETNKTAFVDPHPGHEEHMVLGTDGSDWEDWCEETTRIDHVDYFYLSSEEGVRKLTLPNNAERDYYSEFDAASSKGWILACMAECYWGNCDDGDLHNNVMDGTLDGGEFGKLHMEVNGVVVSTVKCMNKCCALQHVDDDPTQQFIWKPNSEGRYEVQASITDGSKYGYARFSSFIFL